MYAPTRREVLTIDVIDAQIAALEADEEIAALAALEAQLSGETDPAGDDAD